MPPCEPVLWAWGTAIFPSLMGINKATSFAAFPLSDVCLFGAQLQARDSFCLLLGDGANFALVSPARDCLFGDGATFALVSPTCLFGDGSTLELASFGDRDCGPSSLSLVSANKRDS